ncbi:MAG: DUF4198 domain-containing protein [Deltaproteobacteria bacterium]|nr:DUF4198 domain-containing protein [Deltaproteobacteria bacterium]
MKRTFILGVALFIFTAGVIAPPAYAHYLWLTVDKYNPNPGEEINIFIGWGHKFPRDSEPRAKMVSKMTLFIINPQGKKIPLSIKPKAEKGVAPIKVMLKSPGTYLAVLAMKTFVSKTTEGYFYKPKDDLKNVLKSSWSETVAKAIINVGSPGGKTFSKELRYHYQIVPLENPINLKEGDLLPVKVMLNGKPVRTWVYARYASFSQYKDTFAWTTRTNKEGVARVKILKKDLWLIKTNDSLPYENLKKADKYSFTATLTFEM